MRNDHKNMAAFTLLELAIVLVIISMIIAGGLTLVTASTATARYNMTTDRMDVINKALKDYAIAFGRIPCPSDLTLTESSQYYGAEAANNGNTCVGGTPSATFSVTNQTAEGGVPVRALNLPDSYLYDAWGRRFRYAVNPGYTSSSVPVNGSGTTLCGAAAGNITINDATGAVRTNAAVYALISHGEDGHGGYTKNGVVFSGGSTNTDEQTNCHCDSNGAATTYNATYVAKLPTSDSTSATNKFDDIVTFREPSQLLSNNAPLSQCLVFQGMSGTGDNTAFIDYIQILPSTGITNGGFETPALGYGNYQYNPSGTGVGWTFSGDSGVTSNGSGFTGANPAAPDGTQVAFIQRVGSFSQNIYANAGNYTLSFYAANRAQWSGPQQDFNVLVDGTVIGHYTVTSGTYGQITTSVFPLAAASHTITFQGLNSTADPDVTAFIDSVALNLQGGASATALAATNSNLNGSFESPVFANNSIQLAPSNTHWNWTASSGIVTNGSAFDNNTSPDGNQAAFIQRLAGVSQPMVLSAGSYQVKFSVSLRYTGWSGYGSQTINVLMNGNVIGTVTPPDNNWYSYTTSPFTVSR